MTEILYGEPLVDTAAAIAEQWHDGQEHGFGAGSYFERHLEPVATITRRLGYSALYIATAFLHDSKEDTAVTDELLLTEGIPFEVVHAINLLAKKPGQPHSEYLDGILTSPLATVGKFADSSFNFAWTMVNSPGTKDEKFRARSLEYSHNLHVLRPNLPQAA